MLSSKEWFNYWDISGPTLLPLFDPWWSFKSLWDLYYLFRFTLNRLMSVLQIEYYIMVILKWRYWLFNSNNFSTKKLFFKLHEKKICPVKKIFLKKYFSDSFSFYSHLMSDNRISLINVKTDIWVNRLKVYLMTKLYMALLLLKIKLIYFKKITGCYL